MSKCKLNNVKKKRKLQTMHKPFLDKKGMEETIEKAISIQEGEDSLKQIDQTTSISIPLKTIQLIKAMENQTIAGKTSQEIGKVTTTNKMKRKWNAKYVEEPTIQPLNVFIDMIMLIKEKRCLATLHLFLSKKPTQVSM